MEFSHRKASESKVQSSEDSVRDVLRSSPKNSMGFEVCGCNVKKTNGQDMVTQRNIGKVLTGGRRWWKSWWGKAWQNSVSTLPWNLPLLYELRSREINYLCMSYLIIFIPLKTMESSTCQWNLCLQTRFISCLIGWVVVPGLISIVCEEANGNVPYIRVNHP